MLHHLSSGKVAVGAGTDDPVVHLKPPFENHDGVGGRVPMRPRLYLSRVPNQIVLFAGLGILIKKS